MSNTPAPLEIGPTISPVSPNTAASFVGLCPTTNARPPSGRASSTRSSAAPNAAESLRRARDRHRASRRARRSPPSRTPRASVLLSPSAERRPRSRPGHARRARRESTRASGSHAARPSKQAGRSRRPGARRSRSPRAHPPASGHLHQHPCVPSQLDVSRHFQTLIAADPRRKARGVPLDDFQDDDN
jgi:hypothetical protein